jgi:hypothetical protein
MHVNACNRCRGPPEKAMKDINQEIAALVRQITASVTFLPLITAESTSFGISTSGTVVTGRFRMSLGGSV